MELVSSLTPLVVNFLLLLGSVLSSGTWYRQEAPSDWTSPDLSGLIFRSQPSSATSYRRKLVDRLQLLSERARDEPIQVSTTSRPAVSSNQLVTLRPIGNSIQDILYNNGYRRHPAPRTPPPDNIDHPNSLGGVDPSEVWLLREGMLVLRGGDFEDRFTDAKPIDEYQAPYRQPKFPPPGYQPDSELFSGAPLSQTPTPSKFSAVDASWPGLSARSLQYRRITPGSPRRGPVSSTKWRPSEDQRSARPYKIIPRSTIKERPRADNFFTYSSPHAGYTITYTSRQR